MEIRWRRTREDLQEFPPLQKALLEEAARYVKKGGTLVYSTCTLNSKENEDIVTAFLRDHPEFAPIDFQLEGLGASEKGMLTIWPDQAQSDGFFVAKLEKRSEE